MESTAKFSALIAVTLPVKMVETALNRVQDLSVCVKMASWVPYVKLTSTTVLTMNVGMDQLVWMAPRTTPAYVLMVIMGLIVKLILTCVTLNHV